MKTNNTLWIVFILIILITNSNSIGQVNILWTKPFGGYQNDMGHSVQQTTDGGYILTGYTKSFGAGQSDIWLIKTDDFGDTLWTKTFGGANSDDGQSVIQTIDGGYIIAGSTASFGAGSTDIWLIKTNSLGDTLWTKTFGGSSADDGRAICQTTDGGFIIIGTTQSYGAGSCDAWLIKTDSLGDTLWTKTFGGIGIEKGKSVQQTADGGYIIIEDIYIPPDYVNIGLIKTDISGDTIWTKKYGGNFISYGLSVIQTKDKGYLISATCAKIWLIKTDSLGNVLWSKTFRMESSALAYSISQTIDGGYIVFGTTCSSPPVDECDIWLLRTDASGDTLWTKTFGGGSYEEAVSGQLTIDGGYIILGIKDSYSTNFDFWLLKTTSDGLPVELISLTGYSEGNEVVINWSTATEINNHGFEIQRKTKNLYWITIGFKEGKGTTTEPQTYSFTDKDLQPGNYSYRLKQVDFDGTYEYSDVVEVEVAPATFSLSQNYPNPFNPVTTIKYTIPAVASGLSLSKVTLKVYDILGNEVTTLVNEEKPAGSYTVKFDVGQDSSPDLASGIYFYQLTVGNYTATKKLILLK
jgi:hypothetical protein